MKNFSCYNRLRIVRGVIPLTSALLLSPVLTGATLAPAQAPAQPPTEPAPRCPNLASVIDLIDIRDTTTKEAFELVLEAGDLQFALRDDVMGTSRIRASGRTGRECLETIRAQSAQPLISTVDSGIYFVTPADLNSKAPVFHPRKVSLRAVPRAPRLASIGHEPTKFEEVHRQVAGVIIVHGGLSYALLETDTRSADGGPDVRVVSWDPSRMGGPTTHVPSGISTVPDLAVAKIDASGVTLASEDGATVHVILASPAFR